MWLVGVLKGQNVDYVIFEWSLTDQGGFDLLLFHWNKFFTIRVNSMLVWSIWFQSYNWNAEISVDIITDIQGVWTLSDKSNFDIMIRKTGQIFKVKVISWSIMMRNLV